VCISAKKLHRWYKSVLSGYDQAQEDGQIMENDLFDNDVRKRVPILEAKNLGEHMAIDEKHIAGDFYTILTNSQTGKIAMMAQTMKKSELVEIISKFEDKRLNVKVVTRDLSPTYDWVCRESFWNAQQVADKFHVIREVLHQLQQVRIELRQAELENIKIQQATHLKQEYAKRDKAKQLGVVYKIQKFKYKHPVMNNGETLMELLARSRYLLFKMPADWSTNQQARAEALFAYCPAIKQVFDLVISFKKWFNKNNVGKSRSSMIKKLNTWYQKAKKIGLEASDNIAALIQRHEGVILNYFESGNTNAIAESVNAKIQRFVAANYGTRDLDFFLFRLKGYFS